MIIIRLLRSTYHGTKVLRALQQNAVQIGGPWKYNGNSRTLFAYISATDGMHDSSMVHLQGQTRGVGLRRPTYVIRELHSGGAS